MKKLIIRKKLRVTGETIRSLTTHELTHAVGGDETVTLDTGRTVCRTVNAVDSGAATCPTFVG
jgi:hypothetical protein